jgi:outer membrane protein, multidrug efflux system
MKRFVILSAISGAAIWIAACTVGPDYQKPDVSSVTPAQWHWKEAEPQRSGIPKGQWWKLFDDPKLAELEAQAVGDNQNLRAAVSRVDKARAVARVSRSEFFPELSLDPAYSRQKSSANMPTPIPIALPSAYYNSYSLPLDLSYELDLWGRVRRSFESANAQAQASVADYENILLTLTSDVAVNYYLVRSLDSEVGILRRTISLREERVRVLAGQLEAGVIPEVDVERARTDLASAKADLSDTQRQRTETVHAIALLCGQSASSFELPENPLTPQPPEIPSGLPSDLLERRPDIAQAERILVAKNAEIGVARAAYFPAISLTGQAGFLSADFDKLFKSDSVVWSIGPSVNLPLFNAGRTASQVKQAEAAYQEAVSNYRQSVLAAFKEVEDSLAQIRLRAREYGERGEALASARKVSALVKVRYEAGVINSLEVIEANRDELQYERQQAKIAGQRYVAAVRLVKALGGGWE